MDKDILRLYAQIFQDGSYNHVASIDESDDQPNNLKNQNCDDSQQFKVVLSKGLVVSTMKGFCGVVVRVQLGDESIIVKMASGNAKIRPLLKNQYMNEVEFCKWLMKVQANNRKIENLPTIYACDYVNEEKNLFYIVMEDCGSGELDQLSDCSIEDAKMILKLWNGVQQGVERDVSTLSVRSLFHSFINGVLFFEFDTIEKSQNYDELIVDTVCNKVKEHWTTFTDVIKGLDWSEYNDTILPNFYSLIELPDLVKKIRNSLLQILDDQSSIVHGDFRLDNIIKREKIVTFIDFQSVSKGPIAYDISHFTAQSLSVQKRKANEEMLLRDYFKWCGNSSWDSFLQSYKHCVVLQMCYCVLGIGCHWKHYLQSGKLKDPEFLKEKSARVGIDIMARTCHLYIDHVVKKE